MYALTAALHASPVVWVQVAEFTYWTALLNCRRARGHDSADVAQKWPTRSSLRLEAPLKYGTALDKREYPSRLRREQGEKVAGRFIANKCEISICERKDHGTLHYGQ